MGSGAIVSSQSSSSELDPSTQSSSTPLTKQIECQQFSSSLSDGKVLQPSPNSENPLLTQIIQANELEKTQQYLTTGCENLDKFLCGGFPSFGITEVVGESGNGKTQLCLQLSLAVQLPESHGGFSSGK